MSVTAGALSQISVGSTTASLLSAAATAGTAPYTYQWYRSTTSGFTPGVGNIITGATSLTLNDSGLIPNTQYYYKVVATDAVPATSTSSQLSVATGAAVLNPNQFAQSQFLGTIDLRYNFNTRSAQIASSQSTALYAGAAVKISASAGTSNGVPQVVGCSANSDGVLGFINFDIKTAQYVAGSLCEISLAGNVIYLYSTGAITQGAQVQLDVSTMGGVAAKVGSSGANIVGWAVDGAAAAGQLIRVSLITPSFLTA